jgi:hypothetical protein
VIDINIRFSNSFSMVEKLTEIQIQQFIHDGYVRLENAFPKKWAEAGRRILWQETNCNPNDPSTWTKPVIRLGEYGQEPFREAVNTTILKTAFNQLVGEGYWQPRSSLGSFPVRFPGSGEPGDTGWHVDASFPGEDPYNYLNWRINVQSKGRALLMLFLFSDVGEDDAPTRIRAGSHIQVARILHPKDEAGLSFMELAGMLDMSQGDGDVLATGQAGTVYLCHPFVAHAAQSHRGKNPRFMAQPPLLSRKEFQLYRSSESYSPVEQAIRLGIGLD